eukprot:CAMPEP_0202726594 /NCGR_PEP_ID=MMETSP1385-20130828/184692_1 /ASSEMBLY_ACC=CAM_ASM_000861 /TAXON_ID=933848 /ORGANISM="Elphidium margaritaceum" /LENGTH=585 /DNA_ID=CAMNT_0049392817 /DNA_START=159 /DNA_END=1917 /DNA_ORIENTATION=+
MISLDSQMNGQNNNKLNKRRRRSKRHVGGNVGQMIKKEEFEQAMHRSFVHVVESFYLDNVIVAPSGYNQELLVVSWLRQFRRVTVDDFILAVVIQNFLGTGIGSFPECASDKKSLTVRVLDAALDFDIETIFADMKQARKFEMAVSHCDMHAQACKEMSPSNVCYSPGSAVSPDPFVCDGQWIECSPPSTMDALTLVNCNQPYSPRSASPVVFTPRSPSPSDEVLPFPADIDVPLPAPTGYGAAASEFPQLNMYVWPSPSPFLMHQAAVDGSRNDRDRDVAMTGYFHHVNNMVAMPRVPGVPVPQMRQAPVYEYEYATPVSIAYPQRQLDPVLPQPPRPMTPPVLVKPMIPRLNFHAMSVSDIIRQRLTLSEIVRYDSLERLMTDPNGSKYLQWLLKQQFVDNKTECIQFIADHIVCLSRRKFICRVVQEIFKAIDDQQIVMKIAAAFQKQCEQQKGSAQDTLSQCVQCCNANRVLQFLIQSGLPFAAMKFLGDELNRNLVQYSEDRNACHVLQSFVKMYGDKIDIAQLLSNKAHLYLAVQYSEDRNACHVLQSFVKMYGDKIDIVQLLSNKAHLYLAGLYMVIT